MTWSANTGCGTTKVTTGPSGTATCTTSTLAAGTDTVTANYSGDANHNAGSGSVSQVVGTAGTTVSVASSQNPQNFNQPVTFTATITADNGMVKGRRNGVKPRVVSGTVTWSANTGCGTTTVTSGYPGVATCTTSSLPIGTDTVTANYNGDDSNHNAGSGSISQVVQSIGTTTSVAFQRGSIGIWPVSELHGQRNGNSPTGTVQFYVDSMLFDTETLVSGSATSASVSTLAVGTHTVTATYSGDTNNTGQHGHVGLAGR